MAEMMSLTEARAEIAKQEKLLRVLRAYAKVAAQVEAEAPEEPEEYDGQLPQS
jgi:hypothetical protein